ncbi:MAG: hypothetical protein ABI876_18700 [Bacteroidota bacterium]
MAILSTDGIKLWFGLSYPFGTIRLIEIGTTAVERSSRTGTAHAEIISTPDIWCGAQPARAGRPDIMGNGVEFMRDGFCGPATIPNVIRAALFTQLPRQLLPAKSA